MKHLVNIINESILASPAIEDDDFVCMMALVSKDNVDDNLDLMKGMNRVCLVWSPEDCKGYMCANGGVKWDDGKQWTSLKDLDSVIGKRDWKKVDDVELDYSYRGQIGGSKGYDIEAYFTTVPVDVVMKVYKQNGLSLWIRKHSPATAKLSSIFKKWKSKGWLSK